MNDFKCVPIVTWPGTPTKNRRRSPFSAKYGATLRLLNSELAHLGATNVVLQIALEERQIRIDGRPYSNARPDHPGIILTFDTKNGPMSLPCDTFLSWEDNLRAIALTLERLRSIDRYGVTKRGEQYGGWKQLPSAGRELAGMSREAAADILERNSTFSKVEIGTNPMTREFAWKEAVCRTHPDKPGGSDEAFIAVQKAIEVLRQ